MKKLILIVLVLFGVSIQSKAQFYQLRYDSVRVVSKFKLGTVTTGTSSDSVLVKKPNGGVYKVAQSSFGGGGVTNLALGTLTSTTIPITNSNGTGFTLPIATTSLAGLLSAADKVLLNAAVPGARTVAGFALTSNVTLGSHTVGYGLSGSAYNGSAAQAWAVDTVNIQRKGNMITSFGTPYDTFKYPSASAVASYVASNSATASNGLTKTSNNIALGGALTGNTNVNLGTSEFQLSAAGSGNYKGLVTVKGESGSSSAVSLLVGAYNPTLSLYSSLSMSASALTFTDNATGKGVEYASDYSSTFTSRSLVDKAYVDGRGTQIVEITGTTQQASVNTLYIPHNASLTTITLPVTTVIGSLVQIIGEGTGGFKIAQNASQFIKGVGITTTTGTMGFLQSTDANCTITMRLTATNKFTITSSQGTFTVN